MNDEEVAFRIVRLYFEEIARLGFKRSLSLDQMINAYFYTLKKLKGKDVVLKALAQKIMDEVNAKQSPPASLSSAKTTDTSKKVTTTTTTTLTTEAPKSQTVTDVFEEK